jgi:LAS superfamily LD-carboxypeptidase LdcB
MDRGRWAATPGRSHHGLGLAVDLCGGINSFGTAAHLWMVQHASLYGWYHPDWAGAGGSLPEPWHWEYAG